MASFAGEAPLFADGGVATRVVCGHCEYRSAPIHPLLSDLPAFIHLKTAEAPEAGAPLSVMPLLFNEMIGERPGQSLIVERYAEILLIHALRMHHAQSPQRIGFFAGLADHRLARDGGGG